MSKTVQSEDALDCTQLGTDFVGAKSCLMTLLACPSVPGTTTSKHTPHVTSSEGQWLPNVLNELMLRLQMLLLTVARPTS